MRKRVLTIAALLLLLCGIGVLLYPTVANWVNDQIFAQEISDYNSRLETQPNSRLEQLYQDMVRQNEQLYATGQEALKDPFSYEQASFDLAKEGLPGGMFGYISIPRLSQQLPLYLGASKENMAKGAAQLTCTSFPVGGINTNAVIAGHRGMATKEMFRHIEQLQPGDLVQIVNFRETLNYRVTGTKIIQPDERQPILIQPGKDLVTLLTCHPYPTNEQRYIVYCERE